MLHLILWCLWLLKMSLLKSDENSHQPHHPQQSTLDHFPSDYRIMPNTSKPALEEWESRAVTGYCGLEGLGRRLHLCMCNPRHYRIVKPHVTCTAPRLRPRSSPTCCLSTPRHYLQSALIAPHLCRVRISFVIFRLDWWTHQRPNGLLRHCSTLFIYNFHHRHLELFFLWFRESFEKINSF